MTMVSINQPAYLPWLGYYDRIARADIHVELDCVQFEKNSFANRNRIRLRQGSAWLTVPVRTKGRFGELMIDAIEIAGDGRWRGKHWRSLSQAYAHAPHFAEHAGFFEDMYAQPWRRLIDLLRHADTYLQDALGVTTPRVRASSLDPSGSKSALVLDICRGLGGDVYLSGPLGRDYLDQAAFADAGIEIRYHAFAPPVYAQAHPGFEPAMAAVDALFNLGAEAARLIAANPEGDPDERAGRRRASG